MACSSASFPCCTRLNIDDGRFCTECSSICGRVLYSSPDRL
ncbi:Protein of unknown function [Pyronema omphalodes CBS 100304]|uniref:Uncharacterized protein n=1 Tax=Pyronema omphalodes (strain CBS 100304) TaxID=1076935 RepID=U4KWN5_PYROM|nr:Protein of unknown function [Pyronema omphalodes CBS 100304]